LVADVVVPERKLTVTPVQGDMKNIDDLMRSAVELAERGLSKGEVADELNVSRETASWLIERSEATPEVRDQPAEDLCAEDAPRRQEEGGLQPVLGDPAPDVCGHGGLLAWRFA
jgi:DNA-binding XRE family transcriptional regulator